jgi:hypothetical protein
MLNMQGVRRRPTSQSVLIQSQDAYRQCSKTCEVNRFCYRESYLCPLRTMWPGQTRAVPQEFSKEEVMKRNNAPHRIQPHRRPTIKRDR